MRTLLAILGGATVVFLALAMVQEREVFTRALLGGAPPSELAAADRAAAEATVREFLSLMRHLYVAEGDRRFVERLPADPAVVDELLSDAGYLRHNNRRQEPTLVRLEIRDVRGASGDWLEVETREYWTIRVLLRDSGRESEPPHVSVPVVVYRLRREGAGYRIASWDLVAQGEPEARGGGSP